MHQSEPLIPGAIPALLLVILGLGLVVAAAVAAVLGLARLF